MTSCIRFKFSTFFVVFFSNSFSDFEHHELSLSILLFSHFIDFRRFHRITRFVLASENDFDFLHFFRYFTNSSFFKFQRSRLCFRRSIFHHFQSSIYRFFQFRMFKIDRFARKFLSISKKMKETFWKNRLFVFTSSRKFIKKSSFEFVKWHRITSSKNKFKFCRVDSKFSNDISMFYMMFISSLIIRWTVYVQIVFIIMLESFQVILICMIKFQTTIVANVESRWKFEDDEKNHQFSSIWDYFHELRCEN